MAGRLGRWAAPLLAGAFWALGLALVFLLRLKTAEAGLSVLLVTGFGAAPIRNFAVGFAFTLLIPFYMLAGMVLWGFTLALASAFRPRFSHDWSAREGFLLTLSALLGVHLLLWWQVPTTLWLLPGLRALPFFLLFPLLLALTLAFPVLWIRRQTLGWLRGALLAGAWVVAWSILPLAPAHLPRLLTQAKGGSDPAKVLIVGLDGLRGDVGQEATSTWKGTAYPRAYTVIPATRLLWHILWGGDPLMYTIGHAPPTLDELVGKTPLPIIDQAQAKGWKPRFYIDDGGTIGLAGKVANFDDVLMPAAGWENFVNSNMSASFPLFAAWENWGRAFPTTNPWAPLDAGLKEALRLGRGSKLVMFHSCLAHVPIFLDREELKEIPRWWTLAPGTLEPYYARQQVTPARAAAYDTRRDPFLSYTIRMRSILRAWEPIWNGLDQDPHYRGATRLLFSDHGERFHHVTDKVRLSGVHGYNLDPWEARIMLKVDGPGFEAKPGAPPVQATISVLSIRDGVAAALANGGGLDRQALERAYPRAPMRYQTMSMDLFTADPPGLFREMTVSSLVGRTAIGKDGIWFVANDSPAETRAEEVTVAWGEGERMTVIKPLKGGGALRYDYDGLALKAATRIPESDYAAAKTEVKAALAGPGAGAAPPHSQAAVPPPS